MFDNIPALAPPKPTELRRELDHYLSSEIEHISDPLAWWHEHWNAYPRLSRMALDYLTIPAMSIDVEQLFSHGRLIVTHTRSRLSTQSIRSLLCLGSWSTLNLVKDEDVLAVSVMQDVKGDKEVMDDGWDSIKL